MPIDNARMRRAALAFQDLILLAYLAVVTLLYGLRSPGPAPVLFQLVSAARSVLFAATAIAARRATRLPRRLRLGAYRAVIVAGIVWSYLVLRDVLPVVRPDSLDATLAAADAHLFGVEPTPLAGAPEPPARDRVALVLPTFNYYTLQLAFVIGVLYVEGPGPSADEFGFGTALLYCVGQLGYMLVPAFGPVVHYAVRYQGPLQGGPFLHLVLQRASRAEAP